MKFSSQPLPFKKCKRGYHQLLLSHVNFHSLHISSSAPPNEQQSNGSTDAKIQIMGIERHTNRLPLTGCPESPLLYASQDGTEQQVPSSKLKRTIPLSSFRKDNVAQLLRPHADTVHENFISLDSKNAYPSNFEPTVASSDIRNKSPSLILSSKDEKSQFSRSSLDVTEVLPETENLMKDEIIQDTQTYERKEQLLFSPSAEIDIKFSQDLFEQFSSVNYSKENDCCVTSHSCFDQAETSMALKDDYAANNDFYYVTEKKGDIERCQDHPENHQSVRQSSDIEQELRNETTQRLCESKMLLSDGPVSRSCEKTSGGELLMSTLSAVAGSCVTVATSYAPNFSSPLILPLGSIENPKPVEIVIRFEENIERCKDKKEAYDELSQGKEDQQLNELNEDLQELETNLQNKQESNNILKESYYDQLQKLDGDFHRLHENLSDSNESITEKCNSGENLQVSDEYSQGSEESSKKSCEHSDEYKEEHFPYPDECSPELEENFQLSGDVPNCSDYSPQGSIGNIITFSPLTDIEDTKSVSQCLLPQTPVSSSANSPTNVNVSPLKSYTPECSQVNEFDVKDKVIRVDAPNVLWCVQKSKKGLDTQSESLGEPREEKLCILEEHDNLKAVNNMKRKENSFCKVTDAKLKGESTNFNIKSQKSQERNSYLLADSSWLEIQTSDEGKNSFGSNLDKLVGGRNLDDNWNNEQTSENIEYCHSRHEPTMNCTTKNIKDESLIINPLPGKKIEWAALKAKADTLYRENLNTTPEHQKTLEEIDKSPTLKHSNLKEDDIPKHSENHQHCPCLPKCKSWILGKSVVHPVKSDCCNGRYHHQYKVCPADNSLIGQDVMTEQVVPDNESVSCNCSHGSNEHTLEDFQIEEMSKLQHRSPSSCKMFNWAPLVSMLNDSISQANCLHVSDPSSVVPSLAPSFNKKRSIRVGLSKRQKVKRLHTDIRE